METKDNEGKKTAKQDDPDAGMSAMARAYKDAAPYLEIGWMFVFSVGGFMWLGNRLDRWLGTEGRWITVGGVFGIVVGFTHFFKVVARLNQRKSK